MRLTDFQTRQSDKEFPMKITNIYPLVVHGSRFSNYVFVVAETDEGVTGFGDATLDGMEYEVSAAIENFAGLLVGRIVETDNLAVGNPAGGLITSAAASGIDMAMWDLKGKAFNLPVYKLLGGARRRKIQVYASFNRLIRDRSAAGFARMAEKLKKDGNTAMKCHPFDQVDWRTPLAGQRQLIDQGCDRFTAMREAVGPDCDIALDAHWRLNLSTAAYVADRVRDSHPFWLEAPIPERKPQILAQARQICQLLIAGGEMQTSPESLLPLLTHQCLDVYMPDVRYCGGISGMMKMVHLLELYDQLISPHNMSTAISCAASLHACAVMPNFYLMEYHPEESEWVHDLTDAHFVVDNGSFLVPEKPGLGVNLNIEAARKHPYEKAVLLRANMLGA